MSKFIARVNPQLFAAAAGFQANGDVRYYLGGVAIQPHPDQGVWMVATNGHVLIVLHDQQGHADENMIVRIKDRGMLTAMTKAKAGQLFVGKQGSALTELSLGQDEQHKEPCFFENPPARFCQSEIIDGKFPAWQKVIPSNESVGGHQMPFIAAKYFELVGKTSRLLAGKHAIVGSYAQADGNSTAVFRINSQHTSEILIYVMPMKYEPDDTIVPKLIERARIEYMRDQEKLETAWDEAHKENKVRDALIEGLADTLKPEAKPRMRQVNGQWQEVTS